MARSSSCRHFGNIGAGRISMARVSASLRNAVSRRERISLCFSHFSAPVGKWKIQKEKARAGERPGLLRGGQGENY